MEKNILIKMKYLNLIQNSKKTLEARAFYPSLKKIKVGDIITFYCEKTKCKTKIIALRKYSSIKSMLENEEINKLLPNHSFNEAYNVYKKIYPNFKVREFGLLVIEVEKFWFLNKISIINLSYFFTNNLCK